jgi:hypothetical protein
MSIKYVVLVAAIALAAWYFFMRKKTTDNSKYPVYQPTGAPTKRNLANPNADSGIMGDIASGVSTAKQAYDLSMVIYDDWS